MMASALKGIPTLTSLRLSHNKIGPYAGKAVADAVRAMGSLVVLDIAQNELGPMSVPALVETMRTRLAEYRRTAVLPWKNFDQ